MIRKYPAYKLLFAFIIALVTICGCLLKQTIDYRLANRQLILQNDSLTGVVIELNRRLDASKVTPSIQKTASAGK